MISTVKMRNACIKSYNKFYEVELKLKEKQKGRNQDINVRDMGNYKKFKKQIEQNQKKLEKANNQTKALDSESDVIREIIDSLKPSRLNKDNMIISSENAKKIKIYTKNVKDNDKTVRSVNDLNMAIRDFEHSAFEIEQDNRSLKYELELKDEEIGKLKNELSTKDKIINKLRDEKESLKAQLQKFKGFWYNLMSHFHKRICYDKDNNYKVISEDLHKQGIFSDDENEIANNIYKKVKLLDDNKAKKKNDYNLN